MRWNVLKVNLLDGWSLGGFEIDFPENKLIELLDHHIHCARGFSSSYSVSGSITLCQLNSVTTLTCNMRRQRGNQSMPVDQWAEKQGSPGWQTLLSSPVCKCLCFCSENSKSETVISHASESKDLPVEVRGVFCLWENLLSCGLFVVIIVSSLLKTVKLIFNIMYIYCLLIYCLAKRLFLHHWLRHEIKCDT